MKRAQWSLNKIGNTYADELGSLYNDAPKAVLAAIAVSFGTSGGDEIEKAQENVLREWWILFENGIVTQRPTMPKPADDEGGSE